MEITNGAEIGRARRGRSRGAKPLWNSIGPLFIEAVSLISFLSFSLGIDLLLFFEPFIEGLSLRLLVLLKVHLEAQCIPLGAFSLQKEGPLLSLFPPYNQLLGSSPYALCGLMGSLGKEGVLRQTSVSSSPMLWVEQSPRSGPGRLFPPFFPSLQRARGFPSSFQRRGINGKPILRLLQSVEFRDKVHIPFHDSFYGRTLKEWSKRLPLFIEELGVLNSITDQRWTRNMISSINQSDYRWPIQNRLPIPSKDIRYDKKNQAQSSSSSYSFKEIELGLTSRL